MKNFIIVLSFLTTVGCKKMEFPNPNNVMFGAQCLNDKQHPPSKSSPYQRLKWSDGFDSGQSGSCYTMKARCMLRGDWFMGGECPFNSSNDSKYAGLKDLNKCVWKVWHEGTTDPHLTYKADAVEVRDGKLRLKVIPNPYYQPGKGNCGEEDPSEISNRNTNCKFMAGGVDSKYFDGTTHGYNALYGRIEMKARFLPTVYRASYPALWMWPEKIGQGHPITANAAQTVPHPGGWNEPKYLGEIDILESDGNNSRDYVIQSYHQWMVNNVNAYTTKGRTVKLSDDHTFGVEWSPTSVKFYIDDCYTHEIKTGDKSINGSRDIEYVISDTASWMLLTTGTMGKPLDPGINDVFEIDEVRIYE